MSRQKSNKDIYVELRGSMVSMEGIEVLNIFERLPVELRKDFFKRLKYYQESAKIKNEKSLKNS